MDFVKKGSKFIKPIIYYWTGIIGSFRGQLYYIKGWK